LNAHLSNAVVKTQARAARQPPVVPLATLAVTEVQHDLLEPMANAESQHSGNRKWIMNLESVEKVTAKAGWWSRVLGLLTELSSKTRVHHEPFPVPPDVPEACVDDRLQLEGDGFGPLFGRRYEVDFHTQFKAEDVMRRVKSNLAHLSAEEIAQFEKSKGVPWGLKIGDEYDIDLFGPFNGTVRVIEVDALSFAFVTLKGHPEAGRIRFRVIEFNRRLRFQITSWARSRDAAIDLTYDKIPLAKALQSTMWRTFLERIVTLTEGTMAGEVRVSETKLETNT
jgi:hypothetical protein